MSNFFIVGIVLNIVLTGLALYWLWRQRMPKINKNGVDRDKKNNAQPGPTGLHEPDESNNFLWSHVSLLINSFHHWTGRDLIDPALPPGEQSKALYEASFAVASHGTEEDPVFNYANRAALALFETGWNDFTSTPSRLSAEPMERAERAQLLERVRDQGFTDDYSGIRISASGRRFRIQRATVWNVMDAQNKPAGQAVLIHEWEYL